jgi:type I restriction enzyme R subunit
VVKDKQADLDIARSDQFWSQIKAEDIAWLRSTVAPVMRTRSAAEFKAMRFETEVVEIGTALLNDDSETFTAIEESLLAQILELPLTVNVVALEKDFIEEVLRPQWWKAPTEEKLAELVKRLGPLMQYRQRRRDPMMHLNIGDLVASKDWVEFGPEHERLTSSVYREKVEAYIRELVDANPVLQKIRAGEPVTEAELQELAAILREHDPRVTEDLLRKVYDHRTARFVQFIRHILGLERLESWSTTVTRAFDAFIVDHNGMTALQIRFVQTLRTFILQTGKIEKQDLIDAPFTQIHPQGIRGVFPPAQIDEILQFVNRLAA